MASHLRGGEIIGLIGQLGAGKTIFVKGLAKGLDIKKIITSPTFILMKIYPVNFKKQPAIKNLVHLDVYRLKQVKDILAIGMTEYLGKADTVCVIEWADKIKKILPKRTKFVNIEYQGASQRLINS